MTKKEKFQKALEKWVNANKESKNCIVEKHYGDGYCFQESVNPFDIYSPICYRYKPDWLYSNYKVLIGSYCDNGNVLILVLQNSDHSILISPIPIEMYADNIKVESIDCIPEEMLDEMLAVKDFEPIVTIKVPDPTTKDKIDPHGEYKKLVWKRRLKDFGFVLSLIALGVSLIALIVKLC